MNRISTILGLYVIGLVDNKFVIDWADKLIYEDSSDTEFDYICELSLKGADACSRLPSCTFPKARIFTFNESFALRTYRLDIYSHKELDQFLAWICRSCMGLDLEVPEVRFGYMVDHYLNDCDDRNLVDELVQSELPSLIEKNLKIAKSIWSEIA